MWLFGRFLSHVCRSCRFASCDVSGADHSCCPLSVLARWLVGYNGTDNWFAWCHGRYHLASTNDRLFLPGWLWKIWQFGCPGAAPAGIFLDDKISAAAPLNPCGTTSVTCVSSCLAPKRGFFWASCKVLCTSLFMPLLKGGTTKGTSFFICEKLKGVTLGETWTAAGLAAGTPFTGGFTALAANFLVPFAVGAGGVQSQSGLAATVPSRRAPRRRSRMMLILEMCTRSLGKERVNWAIVSW